LLNITFPKWLKIPLVTAGWGTVLATLTVGTIFQGFLLPTTGGGLLPEVYNAGPLVLSIYYLGCLGASALAAMTIAEPGPAIVGFFASYGFSAFLTFIVLALPELTGVVQTNGILQEFAILHTFQAIFPIALLVDLVGTLLGLSLAERLLYFTGAS